MVMDMGIPGGGRPREEGGCDMPWCLNMSGVPCPGAVCASSLSNSSKLMALDGMGGFRTKSLGGCSFGMAFTIASSWGV